MGPAALLAARQTHLVILRVVASCNGAFLGELVMIYNNFLYLILDLLLAYRLIGVGGVLGFGFLLRVNRFQLIVWRFLALFDGRLPLHN